MSIVITRLVKTSSTKSRMIFIMKNAPDEFINWLKGEMGARNWGVRETAKQVGVSHPTISDILTNGIQPSLDTVLALAKKFNYDPVTLLRLSGLLPPVVEENQVVKEICYLAGILPAEKQENVRDYIRWTVEISEKEKLAQK
jgi:transcriptional regulator with XRE-family HTH domain